MYSGMASNCVGASEVAKAVNALSSREVIILRIIPNNAEEEEDGSTHSLQTNSLDGNAGSV